MNTSSVTNAVWDDTLSLLRIALGNHQLHEVKESLNINPLITSYLSDRAIVCDAIDNIIQSL